MAGKRVVVLAFVLTLLPLAACGHTRPTDDLPDDASTAAPPMRGTSASLPARRARDLGAMSASTRSATIALPAHANGTVRIQDDASRLAVNFTLRDATRAPRADTADSVVYAGAVHGGDLVHRVGLEGTEDFVLFDRAPAREELVYDLDVAHVAGLRLVGNTLEALDAQGAPRLRVSPPYVVDARGVAHAATLTVQRCAFDVSPLHPAGRTVTPPGAESCEVRVAWRDAAYPLVVDPYWNTTGALASARRGHTATLLNSGKVLVAGGYDATALNIASAELYDPVSGTFAATGSMAKARGDHSANLLAGGKVLITGGASAGAVTATAELYDPVSGTFTAAGSLATARTGHTATMLASGKVLVVGGLTGTLPGVAVASAELYTPASNSFVGTGPASGARSEHSATLLPSGKVLMAGGRSNNGITLQSAELYDPAAGLFAATGNLTLARRLHSATSLPSGKVLLAGGVGSYFKTVLASAEVYDPATSAFTATGTMAAVRAAHVAVEAGSGSAVMLGGNVGNGAPVYAAEVYDPTTKEFGTVAAPTVPRHSATGTRLASGKILLVGGIFDPAVGVTNSAELLTIVRNGEPCTAAAACESGFCVDGVCCDALCSGQCEACTVASKVGTCSPVTGKPHAPRPGCPGADTTCGGSCDGITRALCTYTSATTVCKTSCADAEQTDRTCDGQGLCSNARTHACEGNFVCGGDSCKTSCTTKSDCVGTFVCGNGGKCVPAAVCTDDHTSQPALGAPVDCGAYRCASSGFCNKGCASVDDCVAPNACDPSARCVAPASETSGCMASRIGSSPNPWWMLAVVGSTVAAVARRSRRVRGTRHGGRGR